jgi:hypothetical protein
MPPALPLTKKAVRFLRLLDEARCQSHWLEVPELARKVEKHAPHRTSTPSLATRLP